MRDSHDIATFLTGKDINELVTKSVHLFSHYSTFNTSLRATAVARFNQQLISVDTDYSDDENNGRV